jgi:transcription elongation factor Elf1
MLPLANIINNYFIEKTKQKQLEKLEPLSTILECAYCNSKNIMTFLPDENEKVEFDCASCKKKNSVNIQFVVARVTEPLNIPSVTGVPLVDDKKVS